ncbi:MAG: VWA domain-containing protein [Candidatus Zapsychrus exili]|nr:VWA domain-containing protein [Candidatus Zapsychrus exili]
MSFSSIWILFLAPIVLIAIYLISKRSVLPSFRFPSKTLLVGIKKNWKTKISNNLIFLRLFILGLFLVALAGPRQVLEKTEITTEGIDIILAVDASGSMAAEDFELRGKRTNRLNIVKDVVKEFVLKRTADRIGIVVFAGQAYTVCPLTTDYDWLISHLERIELGLIKEDGTAIGSSIASSLSRLDQSQAKSKIIILLTDGVNNAGKVEPLKAAEAAKPLGVKIYTIGAGTNGLAPFPTRDLFGRKVYRQVRVDLDEKTLKEIADITEGQYFRATDTESLREIYKEIDKLEKTEIEETGYREYKQLFGYFLLAALALLFIELILINTIFLQIP